MFKIYFPFVEKKYFHYDYKSLLDFLVDQLNFELYESSDLMDFILSKDEGWEGPDSTPIYLVVNGKEMINGSSVSVSSTLNFLLKLNNAFYYLLNGQKKAEVYVRKMYRRDETINHKRKEFILNLELELENSELEVSFSVPVLEEIGRGKDSKYIEIKNEKVNFYQAIEEAVRAIKEYREVYLEAVRIISPEYLETVKKLFFSSKEKLYYSDTPWLPLEQAWQEYKQKHNISDEDVQKLIKQEEKKNKKWWRGILN